MRVGAHAILGLFAILGTTGCNEHIYSESRAADPIVAATGGVGGVAGFTGTAGMPAVGGHPAAGGQGGVGGLGVNTVFLSSATFSAALGGLVGADAKCQQLADDAGLGGTFRAWLSTSSESVAARFMRSDGPYVLVDGSLIASDWVELTRGTLLHAIDVTEYGVTLDCNGTPECAHVFTGAGHDGVVPWGDDQCEQWTSDGHQTALGGDFTSTSLTWGASFVFGCELAGRLYCFEQ